MPALGLYRSAYRATGIHLVDDRTSTVKHACGQRVEKNWRFESDAFEMRVRRGEGGEFRKEKHYNYTIIFITPSPGYCFRSISFVSLVARLRENGRTDLREIFRAGVQRPSDDLITFFVNSGKPRNAAMRNKGTAGVCCAFAPKLVLPKSQI